MTQMVSWYWQHRKHFSSLSTFASKLLHLIKTFFSLGKEHYLSVSTFKFLKLKDA